MICYKFAKENNNIEQDQTIKRIIFPVEIRIISNDWVIRIDYNYGNKKSVFIFIYIYIGGL